MAIPIWIRFGVLHDLTMAFPSPPKTHHNESIVLQPPQPWRAPPKEARFKGGSVVPSAARWWWYAWLPFGGRGSFFIAK